MRSGLQSDMAGSQTRRVQSSRFAAPGGTSPFTSASTWRTVANAGGRGESPLWGVALTFASRACSLIAGDPGPQLFRSQRDGDGLDMVASVVESTSRLSAGDNGQNRL